MKKYTKTQRISIYNEMIILIKAQRKNGLRNGLCYAAGMVCQCGSLDALNRLPELMLLKPEHILPNGHWFQLRKTRKRLRILKKAIRMVQNEVLMFPFDHSIRKISA